jgi:dTDP-glucose pyrophosphorylase
MSLGTPSGPALVALAAGLGSRFGGGSAKQTAGLGPAGETLLDYAVHDALAAGFGRLVCVIRPEMAEDFERALGARLRLRLPVDYAFQRLDDLPAGHLPPPGRSRPWGTGHAVWSCRQLIDGPFAVINADDFYGRNSFAMLAEQLRNRAPDEWSLIAFRLGRTLSPHGPVSRGLCQVDEAGWLRGIHERGGIAAGDDGRIWASAERSPLSAEAPVSLNLWGLTPAVFAEIESALARFLDGLEGPPRAGAPDRAAASTTAASATPASTTPPSTTAELFLPAVVAGAVDGGRARVRLRVSPDAWLGVTHPQDADRVRRGLRDLVESGHYPSPLWEAASG